MATSSTSGGGGGPGNTQGGAVGQQATFMSTLPATCKVPGCNCTVTQTYLTGRLDAYNTLRPSYIKDLGDKVDAELAKVFIQSFKPGSETDPLCKECDHKISHHQDITHNLLPTVNLWENFSQTTATSSRKSFKKKLEEHSQQACPILEQFTTEEQVGWPEWRTAAHILPHKYGKESLAILFPELAKFWGCKDLEIDGPANGFFMCKTFELAFDKLQWCFVPGEKVERPFRIKVVDESLLDKPVILLRSENTKPTEIQLTYGGHSPTWATFNNLSIILPVGVSRRALWYHCYCAHKQVNKVAEIQSLNFNIWGGRTQLPQPAIVDWLNQLESPTPMAATASPIQTGKKRKKRSDDQYQDEPSAKKKRVERNIVKEKNDK